MKKLVLYAAFLLCALPHASILAKPTQERTEIDFETVQYIELSQNRNEGKRIRLSNSQSQELSKQWNQARPIGLCKFYAKYIILLQDKKGEMRTFRASEDTMKEENDYCFVLEDRFIGSLWKSNE